jgi:hypothetical protein
MTEKQHREPRRPRTDRRVSHPAATLSVCTSNLASNWSMSRPGLHHGREGRCVGGSPPASCTDAEAHRHDAKAVRPCTKVITTHHEGLDTSDQSVGFGSVHASSLRELIRLARSPDVRIWHFTVTTVGGPASNSSHHLMTRSMNRRISPLLFYRHMRRLGQSGASTAGQEDLRGRRS